MRYVTTVTASILLVVTLVSVSMDFSKTKQKRNVLVSVYFWTIVES